MNARKKYFQYGQGKKCSEHQIFKGTKIHGEELKQERKMTVKAYKIGL